MNERLSCHLKKTLLLSTLSVIVWFMSSCEVQKRRYQKGFHVQWKNQKPAVTSENSQHQIAETQRTHEKNEGTPLLEITDKAPESIVALAGGALMAANLDPKHKKTHLLLQDCDVIVFRDGSEVKAFVSEVNETEIRYKRCDNREGPLYVARITDVFMVKYAHGQRRVFEEPRPTENKSAVTKTSRRLNVKALLSLIFGILGFLTYGITSIPALILGIMAMKETNRKPDEFYGRGMAIAGIVLSSIILAVFLILLIVLIAILLVFI